MSVSCKKGRWFYAFILSSENIYRQTSNHTNFRVETIQTNYFGYILAKIKMAMENSKVVELEDSLSYQ